MNQLLQNPAMANGFLPVYAAITSALLLMFNSSAPPLVVAFIFTAFLSNVLLAYRSNAALGVKALVAFTSLFVVLPIAGVQNQFLFELAVQICIYAALALGLNIVVGLAGLLDLGYVAFFAVGAYLWGIFGSEQLGIVTGNPAYANGINGNYFWLFLILAVVAAAIVGVLIGLPVLRTKGDYLAIITLGLGEVIRVFANNLSPITNGPKGLPGIARPPIAWFENIVMPLGMNKSQAFLLFLYLLVIVIIAIVILVNMRLDNSRTGRAWIAIRENEIAAQAMGIPLVQTKIIAFATGASFAGIMGVIFAAKQTFVSPESFSFFQSIGVLSMVILGGMGSIPGVILGAAAVVMLNLDILKALSETLNHLTFFKENTALSPEKYERFFFGVILILMMMFRPKGLMPVERKHIEIHDEGVKA